MENRIKQIFPLSLIFFSVLLLIMIGTSSSGLGASKKIPVIFDTDIGGDIDDTWALGFLLKSPELDVKLVVGDMGHNLYRASLLAKFLEQANRTDIPIGIGLDVLSGG